MATILDRDGAIVIPIMDQKETDLFRRVFQECQQRFPEFEQPAVAPFVMGAFGAYGNPSSFHNPFIRTLRMRMAAPMITFFGDMCRQRDGDDWRLEMLFDRMCVRRCGTTIAGEAWHRDLNPAIMEAVGDDEFRPRADDEIYGGFINLDEAGRYQYFECIPGSHLDPISATRSRRSESGFQTETNPNNRPSRVYKIPPGHLLIFRQCILHNVMPRRMSYDSYRQFRCWRLVRHEHHPLQDLGGFDMTIEQVIAEQAVPRLPSGQIPPMYSANHGSVLLWRDDHNSPRLFANKMVTVCQEQKKVGRHSKLAGRIYIVPHRFMRSLREYGLPMYPEYTDAEKSLMRPNNVWNLPIISPISSIEAILDFSLIRSDHGIHITL